MSTPHYTAPIFAHHSSRLAVVVLIFHVVRRESITFGCNYGHVSSVCCECRK